MTRNLHTYIYVRFTLTIIRAVHSTIHRFRLIYVLCGLEKPRSNERKKFGRWKSYRWLFVQKPQKKGIGREEDSALPHRTFKSVAKENTFFKSCIIRGSLNSRIIGETFPKMMLNRYCSSAEKYLSK